MMYRQIRTTIALTLSFIVEKADETILPAGKGHPMPLQLCTPALCNAACKLPCHACAPVLRIGVLEECPF